VHYSQNLDSLGKRSIEHEHFFEACHLEYPQSGQIGMLELGMPSHLGLCGQQAKRLVGSQQESVTEVGAGLSCKVIRLVVETLVGLGRTT
jgi:hypothetical protein